MQRITLDQLTTGQSGTIKKVSAKGPLRRRLLDMGIVNGTQIETLKMAPLGDPIEYRLHGYNLSLRKAEARLIEVEAQ